MWHWAYLCTLIQDDQTSLTVDRSLALLWNNVYGDQFWQRLIDTSNSSVTLGSRRRHKCHSRTCCVPEPLLSSFLFRWCFPDRSAPPTSRKSLIPQVDYLFMDCGLWRLQIIVIFKIFLPPESPFEDACFQYSRYNFLMAAWHLAIWLYHNLFNSPVSLLTMLKHLG